MKELRTPFFTILFIFIFALIYVQFAPPFPLTVNNIQTQKQNLFTAQGFAEKAAVPDTAFLNAGVTAQATTVQEAQNKVNQSAKKIIDAIKGLGIEDKQIKTTNYNVSPEYDYSAGKQTIRGYSVTQQLEVIIKDIAKVNQITDTATANGANIVGNVTFGFDEKTTKQLQEEVRKMAINDAKEKAQSLANAAGMRLGKIVDIQESGNAIPQPMRFEAMKAADTATTPSQITPGENTISTTITLSYQTY